MSSELLLINGALYSDEEEKKMCPKTGFISACGTHCIMCNIEQHGSITEDGKYVLSDFIKLSCCGDTLKIKNLDKAQ